MAANYREPSGDPEDDASIVLIALIVFLAIVVPCVCAIRLRR